MRFDYDFYTTDESFDYPTGYGYATCHEKGYHGFYVEFDENDNVEGWGGYGDYWQADEAVTLQQFYEYVLSVKGEFPKQELMDELIEFIQKTMEQAA